MCVQTLLIATECFCQGFWYDRSRLLLAPHSMQKDVWDNIVVLASLTNIMASAVLLADGPSSLHLLHDIQRGLNAVLVTDVILNFFTARRLDLAGLVRAHVLTAHGARGRSATSSVLTC